MTDPMLANYIAVAVVSGGAVLTGKIVFDWLKNRNGSKNLSPTECFKWKTGVDSCLATHQNILESHEKRLDKGGVDFDGIKKDIAGINTSMAVLANEIKKGG